LSFALDSALEAVSAVFLLAAFLYSYRLSKLTEGAQIIALAKPKSFFGSIFISFASLLAMELLFLLNDLILTIPFADEIGRLLIIVAGFFAVFGLYNAVFYYRTAPRKAASNIESIDRLDLG
jgi:hypothetical protein